MTSEIGKCPHCNNKIEFLIDINGCFFGCSKCGWCLECKRKNKGETTFTGKKFWKGI